MAKNQKAEKLSIIVGVLIFSALCGITLFDYSRRFVNAEVTPKWMGRLLVFKNSKIPEFQNLKIPRFSDVQSQSKIENNSK